MPLHALLRPVQKPQNGVKPFTPKSKYCPVVKHADHTVAAGAFYGYTQNTLLTLPMLRLHSPNAQERKNLSKTSKPCHVGTHWKALTEYFQMSTHLPGFR